MAKNSRQKVPKSDFQSQFSTSKITRIFLKIFLLKNINLGAHFLFLPILCSIKIERSKKIWPFDSSQEKVTSIFNLS